MKDWLAALEQSVEAGRPAALVTIADAKGSSPREAGVKMLVTAEDSAGTVGGGNLEHEAIRVARQMIAEPEARPVLRRFALGPSLGQCCGGNTQLLFERLPAAPLPVDVMEPLRKFARAETPSVLISPIDGAGGRKLLVTADRVVVPGAIEDSPVAGGLIEAARALLQKPVNAGSRVWADAEGQRYLLEQSPARHGDVVLFGAGHVGKAIVHVLASLPFAVTWADDRPEQYPDVIPANVTVRCTPHLEQVVDEAPANAIYLVMSYSHDLDYALSARILQRRDFRYLGLIGSATKRARFEKTMRDLDIQQALVDKVVCPIGLPGISSKQPAVIAVAVAAQILALANQEAGPNTETD